MTEPIRFVTCPNGHTRKFYVSMTSVGAKITQNAQGDQEWHHLESPNGSINIYYCVDCGAAIVVEHDGQGKIMEDK